MFLRFTYEGNFIYLFIFNEKTVFLFFAKLDFSPPKMLDFDAQFPLRVCLHLAGLV